MAEEKTLEVKTEESKPTADTPQSDEKTPDVVEGIDQTLKKGSQDEIKGEEWDKDTVVLTKTDLEKLQTDRDHYKKGLLAAKTKLKASKKPTPKAPVDEGKYLTKEEYKKDVQKVAIKKACENTEIKENWEKVMEHFRHPASLSVEAYVEAIEDAFFLWEKKNPELPEKGDPENKEIVSDLSAEKGKPTGKAVSKGKEAKKTSILPKPTPVEEWYGKKED